MHNFDEYEQALARQALVSMVDASGSLELVRGSVWLTEEGGEDLVLQAGDVHILQGWGRLVVEALVPSQLRWRLKDVQSETAASPTLVAKSTP
ncbi:DUF2917 domain-containing protein [Chitinimonas sp.]|uniref:DUF2917 domain-containing protein n=1 Tax=Chitinimonas sp. TaxID=1934313 RepID=UPI0035B25B23